MTPDQLALIERYQRLTANLEQQVVDRLDAAIAASFSDLITEFRAQYERTQGMTDLLAQERRAILMSDLRPLLEVIRPSEAANYQQMFTDAFQLADQLGGQFSVDLIQAVAPNSDIRPAAAINLEAAAAQAQDARDRLYRYNTDFISRVSGIVEQSMIRGVGTRRVTKQLMEIEGMVKYQAERIARTETLSALNDSSQRRYAAYNIKWFQWVTTKAESICPYCVARNMKCYEVGKVRIPAHPFCRCVPIPVRPEWIAEGLIDVEFSQQYRDDRLSDLRSQGKEPNYGPSPFERMAQLDSAPTPVWSPSDGSPRTRRRSPSPAPTPTPTPAPTPPAPDPTPATLPRDHVYTQNGRFRRDSLDSALDAIATPGAPERVSQFRRFIERHQVQTFIWDESRDSDRQIDAAMRRIRRGDPRLTEEEFRSFLEPLEGANGYTGRAVNHIFLRTQSARRSDSFGVDAELLNQVAREAIEGDHFSLSGIALEGITRETEYGQRRSAADTSNFITYLHEMGHQVHNRAGNPRHPSGRLVSPTDYGLENDEENFAEAFALWMLDAEAYRREDPEGASWIEQSLKRASE